MKERTKKLIPWVGGKAQLMWAIQMLLPTRYQTLVDVFGGSGIITLNTAVPKGCLQIYNDLNHDLYMLLQKTFRLDHITKKKVKNEGQLPQYYVENSHEAIIPPELFDAVQAERKRRSIHGKSRDRKAYPFTGKIICGKCGKNYRRKTTTAGIRWVCSTYNTYGKEFCDAKQIPEDVLESIVANRDFRQICALDEHTLKIIWADGTESTHHWENHSRSESWTAEMREKARARSLKCQRNL